MRDRRGETVWHTASPESRRRRVGIVALKGSRDKKLLFDPNIRIMQSRNEQRFFHPCCQIIQVKGYRLHRPLSSSDLILAAGISTAYLFDHATRRFYFCHYLHTSAGSWPFATSVAGAGHANAAQKPMGMLVS
jgi:hypothetical protein